MQITTVMVVILLVWAIYTVLLHTGASFPPWPIPYKHKFSPQALGLLKNTDLGKTFGLFGILIAFGHSVLAMSGRRIAGAGKSRGNRQP